MDKQSADGVHLDPPPVPLSSPVIKVIEEFLDFCKAKRAAYREHMTAMGGNKVSENFISSKEKISHTFGNALDSESIGQVCRLMFEKNNRDCSFCKTTCDDLVMSVLKIAHDAMKRKYMNNGLSIAPTNIVEPSPSKTVLMTHVDDHSEACIGSIGAGAAATNVKSCSKEDAPGTVRERINAPFEGNTCVKHPAQKTCTGAALVSEVEERGISVGLADACKSHVICVDTPIVHHNFFKPSSTSKSLPLPVHPLNRKRPLSICDKVVPASVTSLFDLHASDGELEDIKQSSVLVGGVCDAAAGAENVGGCNLFLSEPKHNTPNSFINATNDFLAPGTSKCGPFDVTGDGSHVNCPQLKKISNVPSVNLEGKQTSGANDASHAPALGSRLGCVFGSQLNAVLEGHNKTRGNLQTMPANSGPRVASTCGIKRVFNVSSDVGRHVSCTQQGPIAPVFAGEPSLEFNNKSHVVALVDHMYNERNFIDENAKLSAIPAIPPMDKQDTQIVEKSGDAKPVEAPQDDEIFVPENWLELQHPRQNIRFPVTLVHLRYYYVISGLGRSQWKDYVAVCFSQTTTVTFESLGQSIEPGGRCDNFFIAGFCRKFFEDCHPRQSKKHFFYPKVGHSMLSYNSQYDVDVLRNSFMGANSALKLHLADKLFFPVCHTNHWFLFVVDLKNKCFTFIDSYFDEGSSFQRYASSKLVKVFKVVWMLYAESKKDLSSFSILYPSAPKQSNDCDCGIFTLKFMEFWDASVDLRLKFSQDDIPKIRILLASDLYFSDKNSEDKSLVDNLFREGIDPRIIT